MAITSYDHALARALLETSRWRRQVNTQTVPLLPAPTVEQPRLLIPPRPRFAVGASVFIHFGHVQRVEIAALAGEYLKVYVPGFRTMTLAYTRKQIEAWNPAPELEKAA